MGRFHFDEQHFLSQYWQRKPLLIKNALPGFSNPLTPQELAGLALEADVDSRIISESAGIWQLEHGPFQPQDFQRQGRWSLLVQQVDCYVPEVESLREAVAFLPSWRFDDIMVSYATDGGGVGPHFDRYDVFLVQGMGKRLWRLGDFCDHSTPRLEHESLSLLDAFVTRQEYLLEPGDVLYVPPGLAHWGLAVGECMTYSIGFRAPAISKLLAHMTDHLLDRIDPLLLLEDCAGDDTGRPGEITQDHISNAQLALKNTISALDDGGWLAQALTDEENDCSSEPGAALLQLPVRLLPGVRMVWIERATWLDVFVQGYEFRADPTLVGAIGQLCRGETVSMANAGRPLESSNDVVDAVVTDIGALLDCLNELGVLINPDE